MNPFLTATCVAMLALVTTGSQASSISYKQMNDFNTEIDFGATVSQVYFEYTSGGPVSSYAILMDGVVKGSPSLGYSTFQSNYYSFSGVDFNSIIVYGIGAVPKIRDVQAAFVPEGSSMSVLLTGLALAGISARRRRRA